MTANYDSNCNMLRHIRETNPLTMSYSGNIRQQADINR